MAAPASSSSSMTPLDICKAAAFSLYMNGSDARQQKNGNPGNLVESCMSSPVIASVGLYRLFLSAEDRKIVNDKKACMNHDFLKKIASIIIKCDSAQHSQNPKNVQYFVRIPTAKQMEMLKAAAAGKLDSYKDREINNMLSPRRIFIYQERQKVDA